MRTSYSIFGRRVVWIAIQPAFAWLGGSDDRMSAGMRVFSGVPIRRAVAAQRHSTSLARPQVHPVTTDLHARFAFTKVRLFDGRDCVEMRTASIRHHFFSCRYVLFESVFGESAIASKPRLSGYLKNLNLLGNTTE